MSIAKVAFLLALGLLPGPASVHAAAGPDRGLTAVPRLLVGHAEMSGRPTGCTVIRIEPAPGRKAAAVGGVDVRGGAPGSRETELLAPQNLVEEVHAIVLAGGSAFGLDAAGGAMRWLEENGIGFDVGVAKVPIVPAAILFDLPVGGKPGIRPDAGCGYRAAAAATASKVAEGNVGAGAGATIGKIAGMERAMKGGLGGASIVLAPAAPGRDALVVAALVAVNAFGDVIDPATGQVIAGVRDGAESGGLADARRLLRGLGPAQDFAAAAGKEGAGRNTTLAVVATNARLTKAQAQKIAQMAQDGLARAISPAHTPFDGDTVFVLATGDLAGEPEVLRLGALAAEAVATAIVRAVEAAESLPGLPARRDLRR
jgi:L-aminopeptidase/D-esterase-like protein